MIEQLNVTNFQGVTESNALSAKTVFTGRNFTGKTTVYNALVVACLGHYPKLGATAKATFKLASGTDMLIEAVANGSVIRREFRMNGKTVKATVAGDVDDSSAWKAVPLRILNPESFMAETAKQRLSTLAALAGGKAVEEALETAKRIAKLYNAKVHENLDPLANCENVAVAVEAVVSGHAAEIKRLEASLLTFADLDSESEAQKPADLEAARKAEREALHKLTEASSRLNELQNRMEAARQAVEKLSAGNSVDLIAAAKLAPLLRDDHRKASDELREKENTFNLTGEQLNNATAKRDGIVQKLGALTLEEATKQMEALESIPERDIAAMRKEERLLDAEVSRLQGRLYSWAEKRKAAEEELQKLESCDSCPTCKSSGEGWRDAARKYYQAIIDEAKSKYDTINADAADVAAKDLAARSLIEAAELDQRRRASIPALAEKLEMFAQLASAETAVIELEAAFESASNAFSAAQFAEADTEERLQVAALAEKQMAENHALSNTVNRAPSPAEMEAAQIDFDATSAAHTEAERSLHDAQAQHDLFTRQSERWNQMQSVKEKLEEYKVEKKKAAEHAGEVRDAMTTAVESSYGPILTAANAIGENVMKLPLAAHDGELGVWRDSFVPWEIMSGTEQLIALAAIQAALSSAAGGILLLDELSRVDSGYKKIMVENIEAMIDRGALSQCVIIDHDAAFWREKKGWTVHEK